MWFWFRIAANLFLISLLSFKLWSNYCDETVYFCILYLAFICNKRFQCGSFRGVIDLEYEVGSPVLVFIYVSFIENIYSIQNYPTNEQETETEGEYSHAEDHLAQNERADRIRTLSKSEWDAIRKFRPLLPSLPPFFSLFFLPVTHI